MDRWPELFLDGTVCAESDTLESGTQRAGVLRGSYPGYLHRAAALMQITV